MLHSVSFSQYLVLFFLLYLIFGDPVGIWYDYKERRELELIALGLLPPPPLDPWSARLVELEREFNLMIDRLLALETFVFTPDLGILNKKDLLALSTSIFNSQDTIIKSSNLSPSDYWTIKSDFEDLKLESQIISEQLYSLTSNYLNITLELLLLQNNICNTSINQFNGFLDQNDIINLYTKLLLARMEEFNALQSRFLILLKLISQIQDDFRREHAEFLFEKDSVLRQLEEYKETLTLYTSKIPFQFKKKKKYRKKK